MTIVFKCITTNVINICGKGKYNTQRIDYEEDFINDKIMAKWLLVKKRWKSK
mgnify:CR=1 FL=1